jgi:hypothetical protein
VRIRLTVPGEPNEENLGIALEAATLLAQHDVREGNVPPIQDAIDDGVVWKPEPPGDESFDRPLDVVKRGWMDCDDAAPWLAAEMRENGYDEGARALAIRSGPRTWHAYVKGSDGQRYDPSVWAGMPHTVIGQGVPCCAPLLVGRPAIQMGMRRVRVDVPGIRVSAGCVIGASHECDCEATDEDRIRALIDTVESAIITAQLARTGDARALRALAVIWRVLRGEAPEEALRGVSRHEAVGIVPCLAALGPLGTAAVSAGTIAAIADPLAAALQSMVGTHTDFGKVLGGLREALGPIKIASAAGAGVDALAATMNIPFAAEAVALRWYELLKSPLEAAGVQAGKIPDIARAVGWTEKALSRALPAEIATKLAAPLLDLMRMGRYQDIARLLLKDTELQLRKYGMAPDQARFEAEAAAAQAIKAMSEEATPAPIMGRARAATRIRPETHPEAFEEARTEVRAPVDDEPMDEGEGLMPSPMEEALAQDAEEIRAELRPLPSVITVPLGWPQIFAAGCRQMTEEC